MISLAGLRQAVDTSTTLLRRLVGEEGGQDIVEYAFLAVFVGVTSYLTLNGILAAVGVTYSAWLDPSTGVPSHWEPPVPSGS